MHGIISLYFRQQFVVNAYLVALELIIVSIDQVSPIQTSGEQTDAALVARSKVGDVAAFGELVMRYQGVVYGVVSRMVSDRDDVDDIVQEVFVISYKSIATFRCDSAFSTWIYRIAVNTTLKQMKKIKTRRAISIDDPLTRLGETLPGLENDQPDKIAEQSARNEALRKAIETLPEKHRAVVVLHYFQNCSCAEIAKILGCSVGTVWSRLHFACRKLKGQIGWLGDGGSNVVS
ncbi:MAG: sigma-70 family RNA polymerase sigma factor [Armatimonadota bacterium]|nr:sigma-70 family RNA polymerase sigma factor [bacterium]